MKRYFFLIVLSLALGVGAYVFILRDPAPVAMAPAARKDANPPIAPQASKGASPVPKVASRPEESPAWMSPPAGPTSGFADRTAASKEESAAAAAQDAKLARIEAVMAKFQRLQSSQNPQPREIAAAIGELESVNGSPVLNGVRLDVLRQNVLVAEKMQAAGDDMRKLQSGPDSQSPQKLALVKARLAELESLRTQLRSDVMEPKASAAP